MAISDIKEKVCKLLALSNSSNEAEATLALTKAQEIILLYKLSIAECLAAGQSIPEDEQIVRHGGTPLIATTRIALWQTRLCSVLSNANDCKILLYKGTGIVIFGRTSDIENVRTMLSFCIGQLWKLSPKGKGKVYSDSWYLGAIDTMRRRLAEMKVQVTSTATTFGLVKLEERSAKVEAFIQDNIKVGKASQSNTQFDGRAYFQGKMDGEKINLTTHKSIS